LKYWPDFKFAIGLHTNCGTKARRVAFDPSQVCGLGLSELPLKGSV
jgi:hypothetical protein